MRLSVVVVVICFQFRAINKYWWKLRSTLTFIDIITVDRIYPLTHQIRRAFFCYSYTNKPISIGFYDSDICRLLNTNILHLQLWFPLWFRKTLKSHICLFFFSVSSYISCCLIRFHPFIVGYLFNFKLTWLAIMCHYVSTIFFPKRLCLSQIVNVYVKIANIFLYIGAVSIHIYHKSSHIKWYIHTHAHTHIHQHVHPNI